MANSKDAKLETGNRRLDSWKDIAQYLERNVTTVMRWERERALPVHRVPGHAKRQTVYAYSQEIDNWLLGTGTGKEQNAEGGRQKAEKGARVSVLGVREQEEPTQTNRATAPVTQQRRSYLGYLFTVGCVAIASAVVYMLARPAAIPRVFGYQQITNDGRQKENPIVTDGARIYFAELNPSGWAISQVRAAGGEVKPLSTFFNHPSIQDLSRRRSDFLILDAAGIAPLPTLWAMPLSGSSPRRVGKISASAAAWTPDGNSIVYAVGNELFLCTPDGSGSRKFAFLPGRITNIRWSPSGKRLRVTLTPPNHWTSEIWEIRADGSNVHPLLPGWRSAYSQSDGQWTRDGKYFVFDSPGSSRWDLWALPKRGGIFGGGISPPVKLTNGPLSSDGWVPSPDGKKAFLLERGFRVEMLRYAKGPKQFALYFPGVSADYLDFTRDGQWTAYSKGNDGSLWKRRSDGSHAAQLTFPPMKVELPRWSPDGKWIAFMGTKNDDDIWRVYIVPAEGGEARVVMPSASPQGAPTWSPDGKQLAFGDLALASGGFPKSTAIHIVDLTSHEASTLPGSSGLWTARWSPDGSYMAAITTDTKTLKIYDFHSAEWQDVVAAGSISDLNWSHKGDAIYFVDVLPATGPVVYCVSLEDRKVEKVATLTGRNPIRSGWLGLAPDDSILVSNSVGTSEIYALNFDLP